MKIFLISLFLLFLSPWIFGQNPDAISPERLTEMDLYAQKSTHADERSVQTLSAYLESGARSQTELAYLIYSWIGHHIQYDARAFNTGRYGDLSASGVLKSRKGVCDGFANLYAALCMASGLEAYNIGGYAKGYGYRPGKRFYEPDHAWNVVEADGRWMLVDPTWGEGYGEGRHGRMVARKHYNDYWFDVDPQEFIFTHFPEDPKWQLLKDPVSKTEFEKLPWVDPMMHFYGFPRDAIYEAIRLDPKTKFATIYMVDGKVEILKAPVQKRIKTGEQITIRLHAPEAVDVATINNEQWLKFNQDGDEFFTTITPETGRLYVGARFSEKEKDYQMILEYQVGK
jgi:hypothetical protein